MKQNKIKVVVGADDARPRKIKEILVNAGLAVNMADAAKLIKPDVYDIKIPDAYFIAADNYNFRESPITLHLMFQAATAGILVVVGCKKLPPEYEFLCEVEYV